MNSNETLAMTSGNCGTCKFWAKAVEGRAGWRMGMGKCTNVPKYYDVGQDPDTEVPADYGANSFVLKQEFLDVKAVALDGSGYCAELLTTADFACICFVPSGNTADQTVVDRNGESALCDRSIVNEIVVALIQDARAMEEMGAMHLLSASQEQIESITELTSRVVYEQFDGDRFQAASFC